MRTSTSTKQQTISSRFGVFCLLAGILLFMSSCRDTMDFNMSAPVQDSDSSRGDLKEVTNPDGLIQQADWTWKADNKRVPLVGVGRVVNSFAGSLLKLLDAGSDNFGHIVDTDITNYTAFSTAGVEVDLKSSVLVSVRDIYRTYAKGQQVGFAYIEKSNVSVLSVDLLKNMKIVLLRDGKEVQSTPVSSSNDALGVNLLSLGALSGEKWAERSMSVIAESEFDEVALDLGGVDLSALSGFQFCVKYAFVGENPEIVACGGNQLNGYWTGGAPVINEGAQSGYTTDYTQSLTDEENIVNDSPTDCAYHKFNIFSLLSTDVRATVNFNREIPVGTEVGFKYSYSNTLLNLKLLGQSGPDLYTYKDGTKNEDALQSVTPPMSLLNLGVVGSESPAYASMLVEEENTKQLQIKLSGNILDGGLSDLLGGLSGKRFNIYYAYVREPVTVDVSSYFSISDTEIYGNSYTLPKPEVGTVSYHIVSQPYGANAITNDNRLTEATKEGAYIIQAVYASEGGKGLSHVFTVYRKKNVEAGSGSKFITAASNGAFPTDPVSEEGGCLLCLFNSTNNLNALVDNDPENYATYTHLLSAVGKTPLAAIEMSQAVNASQRKLRAGFIVQANSALLNVSLLQDFEIRLYNNGNLINSEIATRATAASDNSSVLGLDLISGGTDKYRLYVTTDRQFDHIELWKKQGVGVGLFNNLRMYGVFYEDATEKQVNANEMCMEVMNSMDHGVEIDYSITEDGGGLIDLGLLGNGAYGFSYLLDNDLRTGLDVGSLLSVLSEGTNVGLKFNALPLSQPIGVVLEKDEEILNLDLSLLEQLVSVTIQSGDVKICTALQASVLDLDLLDSDKRIYFELIPAYNLNDDISAGNYPTYDGIVIGLNTGVLSLSANHLKITGIYTRTDSNGDGIPDCVDTQSDIPVKITTAAHACVGEPLKIQLDTKATQGTEYLLQCENRTTGDSYEETVSVLEEGNEKYFSVEGLPYGRYYVSVYALGSGNCLYNRAEVYVHALLTEWTGAEDTDWNNWENWTQGAPWHCTDVILQKNARNYPVLKEDAENCCGNIHFEAGAMLARTDLLTYDMAFVDVLLKGGDYNYFVSPLQATVTGDMFINPTVSWTKNQYFTMPGASSYPEMRTSPVVYQQASVAAYDYNGTASESEVQTDGFTQDFNGVNQPYAPTALYKVKPGSDVQAGYYFRLPKDYGVYRYFSPDGKDLGVSQSIDRREGTCGKLYTGNYTCSASGGKILVTNPYMAYVAVTISAGATVKSYSDGMYYSAAYTGGTMVSTNEAATVSGSSAYYIPPMSGIIIEGVSEGTSVTIEPAAQCVTPADVPAAAASRSAVAGNADPQGVLRVVAEKDGRTSSCILYRQAEASDALKEGEDVRTLRDAFEAPVVAVYSLADGKAADIQQFNSLKQIDLGMILRRSGTVKLKFRQDGSWDDWYLLDRQTSRVYFLNEVDEVVLDDAVSGNNRLSLIKK